MPKYLIILLLINFRECTVLRGTRVQEGQFPWLIQFHTISPCGGVLISPDWVLTAAQCVQSRRNSIVLYATGLNGTGSRQAVSVKATYIYPQFQGYFKDRYYRDYENNIALLKLVKAFDMCDDKVRLLDIAPVRMDSNYKSCLIFGWQSTVAPSSKVHAKPIQYSRVLLTAWRICMYVHSGNASLKNVFCTMIDDDDEMRACAGNPGSPVVCEDQYQRMVLLGIASWTNFSLECGGLPTYLEVSDFRAWMWDLIFGDKNMEQWQIGTERRFTACNRELHSGTTYSENKFGILGIRNFTHRRKSNPDEETEEDYRMSWLKEIPTRSTTTQRISPVSKSPEPRNEPAPGFFDDVNDYTRSLEGPKLDYDVAREREERLNQYREIGKPRFNPRENDEPLAVPSENNKIIYHDVKTIQTNGHQDFPRDDSDNWDILELVMPGGLEDFYRSGARRQFFEDPFLFYMLLFHLLLLFVLCDFP